MKQAQENSGNKELPSVRIEGEDQSENEQVLRWRQANHAGRHIAVSEKPAALSPRVIEAVFEPRNRICPPVWDAIFERGRDGFDGLRESGPAAIAVPGEFGTKRHAPRAAHGPVNRQLRRHPQGARAPSYINSLCSNLIFKCSRKMIHLPLGDAIRKETPEFERSVGLVRPVENCLFDGEMLRCTIGDLPAGTRNIVGMRKMPIAI